MVSYEKHGPALILIKNEILEGALPLLYYVQNTCLGITLILIILFYVLGQGGKRQAMDSLFLYLVFSVLGILITELGMHTFDGRISSYSRFISTFVASLFYLLAPLPGLFYFLYVDQLHHRWHKIPKHLRTWVIVPMSLYWIFVFMSLSNGYIFYIDGTNTYRRGKWFFVAVLSGLFYVCVSYLQMTVYARRSKLEKSMKSSLVPLVYFIPLPACIALVLHLSIQGMEVIGVAMAITMLLIFLQIQNIHANKDYLTSLYNRSLGEQYLQHLFMHKHKGMHVGGMLVDINGFKAINDTFGHDLGDMALQMMARVLKDSFSRDWIICRYGGDEFLIFRELESGRILEESVGNLQRNLAAFNSREDLPVPLTISIGFDSTEDTLLKDWAAFIKRLDERMYAQKSRLHIPDVLQPEIQKI